MATLFKPAIVVVAYNRPDSLRRLLEGVAAGIYPTDVAIPLIISIDKSDSRDVVHVAETFQWPYGPTRIIEHPHRLGLRDHIISCGDLAYEYGSVIILEDDLMVSPAFYRYAQDALAFYEDDARIAGVSLYTHAVVPYLRLPPFIPLSDEGDVFFIQYAASWGQAWSASQWRRFRDWYDAGREVFPSDPLPEPVTSWPDSSWLKYFIKYMVEDDLFFVYPRYSFTTNYGDLGVHFNHKIVAFQVPLVSAPRTFRFQNLDTSIAVYDAYFELLADRLNRLTDRLSGYSYEVDTYGTKDPAKVKADYLLTRRPCQNAPLQFGIDLKPMVLNVVHGTPGESLSLCARDTPLGSMKRVWPPFNEFHQRYSLIVAVCYICLKVKRVLHSRWHRLIRRIIANVEQ